ncbi:MAG: hypothetical protein ACJ71Q_05635 [Terriglobales bacterium]
MANPLRGFGKKTKLEQIGLSLFVGGDLKFFGDLFWFFLDLPGRKDTAVNWSPYLWWIAPLFCNVGFGLYLLDKYLRKRAWSFTARHSFPTLQTLSDGIQANISRIEVINHSMLAAEKCELLVIDSSPELDGLAPKSPLIVTHGGGSQSTDIKPHDESQFFDVIWTHLEIDTLKPSRTELQVPNRIAVPLLGDKYVLTLRLTGSNFPMCEWQCVIATDKRGPTITRLAARPRARR